MKIPPAVSKTIPLEVDSPVCDICWKDLWFQMVFAYRQAIDAEMPEPVRRRKACYWGINCRTMDHNQEHAKTYNHYIYQQRF